MSYEPVKRNKHKDPDPAQLATHISKYHSDDVQDFHIPLERMHHSNLHDWGIARGLEVSGTSDGTEIVINAGVAIDRGGQLISLSSEGHADIGENPPQEESNEVIVPVHLSTDSYAGKTVYVTIQFSEILRPNDGVLGRWEQVPWVRLQPVEAYDSTDDVKSIVLAIAVIKTTGKLAELKIMDSTLNYRRRLMGDTIEEIRIQRSSKIGDEIQEKLSGKIGPGDSGGLKIIVPDAQDSILFAREGGSDFLNLEIRSNVGIGTPSPSEKLEVNGTVKAGKFLGDGSELAGIKAGQWTDVSGGISYNLGNVGIGTTNPLPNAKLDLQGGGLNIGGSGNLDAAIHIKTSFGGFDRLLQMCPTGPSKPGLNLLASMNANNQEQWWVWGVDVDNKWKIQPGIDFSGAAGLSIDPSGTIRLFRKNAFQGHDSFLRINQDNEFPSGTHFARRANFAAGITTGNWWNVEPGWGNLFVQGNVGIGTTNPMYRLDVYGTIGLFGKNAFQGSDDFLRINQNNEFPSGTHFAHRANFFGGITTGGYWNVDPGVGNLLVNGNVGIGTTAPDSKLEVVGGDIHIEDKRAIYCHGEMHIHGEGVLFLLNKGGVSISNAWGGNGNLFVTGNAFKPGGGSWGVLSDVRLKKNVEPLTGALNKLLRLRGVSFEWIEPEKQGNLTGTQMGMVADEVEEVFPEWVSSGSDGYKNLTIRGFEALSTEAIRELNGTNEELRAKNKELEDRIKELEKRLKVK